MLIERLMRERWFRVEPDPVRGDLAWGSFFADPMQTPDPAQMTALMPAFRDWTMARVAALPDRLLMPRGPVPMGEPQCLGFTEVNAPAIGTHPSFVLKNAASLLGDMTAMAATEHLGTAETHRPGPDRLWVHDPNSQTQSCRYHGRSPVAPLQSQVPVDAGRVAALVGTAAMPVLAHGDDGLSATAVTLRRDVLRLEKPQGAPDKLRGVLVAAGPVEAITGWRGHTGRDMAQALALTSPDWAGPGDLATRDILGLTTGMTLAEFETGAIAHLGQAVRFVEEVPGKGMFGHARGFLNMETGEALAAIYAPRAEGQPVVAIMRRIMLPASEPGLESIKLSLTQKYGENIEEFQEGRWQWSTLPKGEDGWGVCVGGRSLIAGGRGGREGAPRLIPDGDLGQPVGSHFGSPDYWVGAGWPEMVTDRPGQLDPERCGLVVGAFVTQVDDRRMMQIWLLDRKLAGTLDAIPAPRRSRAAEAVTDRHCEPQPKGDPPMPITARWLAATLAAMILCATAAPSFAWDLRKQPDSASTSQVEGGKRLTLSCLRGRGTLDLSLSDISAGTDLSAPLREISISGNLVLWIGMPDGSFTQDAFTAFDEQGSVAASIPVDAISWDSFGNGEKLWLQDTAVNDPLFASGMKSTGAARLAFLERCGF